MDKNRKKRLAYLLAARMSIPFDDFRKIQNVIIANFIATDDTRIMKLLVGIDPVQFGTGDPSPDNVRPISGFNGTILNVTGKNLFNKNRVTSGYALDAHGVVTANAEFGVSDYIKIDTDKITVSGVTYNNVAWSLRVHAYDSNMTWISQIKELYVNSASVTDTVINVPDGVSYIRMSIGIVDRQNLDTLMVEYGSSVSAYEPFGTSYLVSWQSSAGTVYGGTLDVVSGLLTVTMVGVDLGTLEWTSATTNTSDVYRMRSTGISALVKKPASSSDLSSALCSNYKTVTGSDTYRCTQGVAVDASGNVQVYDADYNTSSSAAAFTTAMSGVQLVYELAAPQTYQLDPVDIQPLLGENNIWANTGDILILDLNY